MKITEDPTGGKHVIVDTVGAVIPARAEVALLSYDDPDKGMLIGLELEGPRTDSDVASNSDELYLMDVDMSARLVTLLLGIVSQHAAGDVREAFFDGLDQRLALLRASSRDGGRR